MDLQLRTTDLPDGLAAAEALHALQAAAARWSEPAIGCTGAKLSPTPSNLALSDVERDGVNEIVFHSNAWCRSGVRRFNGCYDRDMTAVTTLYFGDPLPGTEEVEIVEADIELNAVDFRWSTRPGRSSSGKGPTLDLQTVLAHELGHVLGLAHACTTDAGVGQRLPACGQRTLATIMLPFFDQGVVANVAPKRALSSHDRRAVCELYPASMRPSKAPSAGKPRLNSQP